MPTQLALSADGARLAISGPMTVHEAPDLLDALAENAGFSGITQVDLSGVQQADSAALSVLLAISRAAAGGSAVTVHHAPPSLSALSNLYGLQSLCWVG